MKPLRIMLSRFRGSENWRNVAFLLKNRVKLLPVLGPRPCCLGKSSYNTRLIQFFYTKPKRTESTMPRPKFKRKPRTMQRRKNIKKTPKTDPVYVDGEAPRPMYVDYKDLDLLGKLTNRHGRIVSRRKTGCHAASQHAVARAIKRARFMALLPYVGD